MNGLTNATSQDTAWGPKHQTAKPVLSVRRHYPKKEVGSQKTWVFISLHRFQIRYSKIRLILARPLPIGYFTFYYFSFSDFNRMDAWSLMRSDAFIHFVSGSRRVNIRLGVLLLIPKSPQLPLPKARRLALQRSLTRLLWGGARPMVRRRVCIQRTRNGGLGMLDLESHWLAERLGPILDGGRSVETKGELDFSSPQLRLKGWRSM